MYTNAPDVAVPFAVVTLIVPEAASEVGTTARSCVADTKVIVVAFWPLNFTFAKLLAMSAVKFVPVIETAVLCVILIGEKDEIVGV